MKLLLDENLSPKVVEILASDDGLDACHIRDRGLLGATDPECRRGRHHDGRADADLVVKLPIRGAFRATKESSWRRRRDSNSR